MLNFEFLEKGQFQLPKLFSDLRVHLKGTADWKLYQKYTNF